jgi:hypothetical protein
MFGKLLKLSAIAICATTTTAAFTYGQMSAFTRGTIVYLNSFSSVSSTCLDTNVINQLSTPVSGFCSVADTIDFFNIQGETTRVANLFSQGSTILSIMANSMNECNLPGIKTMIEDKSTELANWASQIQSGAPVSLSQVSAATSLKNIASDLQYGLMSSAGYSLGESIQFNL